MRDPSSYKASDAPSSAAHQALMNHCWKSSIDIRSFLKSLSKCPRSRASNWESIVKISAEEMRRRFNRSNLAQVASELEYRCCVVDINAGIQLASEPPGNLVTGVMMGLVDAEGNLVAKMHGYVRDDGTLGGRGYLDPTLLIVDGVCMRMLPKPPPRTNDG